MRKLRRAPRRTIRADLQITSLMDLITIILVFLLVTSSSGSNDTGGGGIVLPVSSSQKAPEMAVVLRVWPDRVDVDGEAVLQLMSLDLDGDGKPEPHVPEDQRDGRDIRPVGGALQRRAREAQAISEQVPDPALRFQGELLLQVDRDVPYELIEDLLYTAREAGFRKFKFAVSNAR